jgi:hypothetical protein
MKRVIDPGPGKFELQLDNLFDAFWPVNVQFSLSVEQAECGYQADQAVKVISVQMGDEDVFDP